MKFTPHHFPVGTVFKINDDVRLSSDPEETKVYTVRGIVRNGRLSN